MLFAGLLACQTSVKLPPQAVPDVAPDQPVYYDVDGILFPVDGGGGEIPTDGASDESTAETEGDALVVGDSGQDAKDEGAAPGDTDAADVSGDGGDGPDGDSCAPACEGKACGDDGCGGSCGGCPTLWACEEGLCVEQECVPLCGGRFCGFDGCGGVCGFCPAGTLCDDGQCVVDCTCEGKECGGDGCGLSCGICDPGYTCIDTLCDIAIGQWTCTQILGCLDQCQSGDAVCQADCVAGGTTLGQFEYEQYSTCLENHQCDGDLCIAEFCATETVICQYETSGTLSCDEIVGCQNLCDGADQVCIDGCIPQGTIDAQAEYVALIFCVQTFCPLGSSDDCMNFAFADATLCGGYYEACLQP
jgi:hypothetical protein